MLVAKAWRRLKRLYWSAITPSSYAVARFTIKSKLGLLDTTAVIPPAAAASLPSTQALPGERAPRREPGAGLVTTNRIPRIVFQTWKTRDRLPANYAVWSHTFRQHNPRYDCLIWDDTDNLDFIQSEFPWFLDTYRRYPKEIFRADIVRLFFLYRFGGLYADMDTECLKPLDDLLADGDFLLARMGHDLSFEHSIPNAMMASKPDQLFWLLAISLAIERAQSLTPADMAQLGPESLTGPILVKETVDFYINHDEQTIRRQVDRHLPEDAGQLNAAHGCLRLLGPDLWYPVDWTNSAHRFFRQELMNKRLLLSQDTAHRLFPSTYLATYWTHSW